MIIISMTKKLSKEIAAITGEPAHVRISSDTITIFTEGDRIDIFDAIGERLVKKIDLVYNTEKEQAEKK